MVRPFNSRLYIAALVAAIFSAVGCSEEPDADSMVARETQTKSNHPASEFPDLVEWRSPDVLSNVGDPSDRPTLLYFADENCGFCLSLQIAVLSVEEHAAFINRKYLPVKVTGPSELRARFGIQGVPVLIVLNAESEEVGRLPGWPGLETTIAFIAEHANVA
jgi:thioredoxin-related protein